VAGHPSLNLEPRVRSLLNRLAAFFSSRGIEAYATGGFLRDALMGRPVRDIDISARGDPLALAGGLAAEAGGHWFPLDEERRLARVQLTQERLHIDLQPLRGDIQADLRGRDYTIDAMASPMGAVAAGQLQIIDPTGGLADLEAGVLRAVSEAALRDDPLRLLRGPRIAAQLGFRMEAQTQEMIRRHAPLLARAAAERQRDELRYILATPRAGQALRLVDALGLLAYLLPELEPARGAEQPKEHYWDVLGHSLATVEYLDVLLSEAEPEAVPGRVLWQALWSELAWWQEGADYFREEVVPWMSRAALLKLGGLLHDVGKPATRSTDETGRMRFFGHQHVGADIAAAALRRLRFSSREVAMVRAMVAAHLRPVQMAQQGPPTRRAIYRFFRDTGEAGIETLFLSLADHLATVGPRLNEAGWRRHVALTSYILEKRLREADVVAPPKLLKGEEVMAALGLPPGPLVGQLLEAVREAQAAGEISTREEALALARRLAAGARAIEDPGRRT